MHTELNQWSRRLSALSGFDAPAAGWAGVLAARGRRQSLAGLRWPVPVAAAVLALAAGLGWWLHATQRVPVQATATALSVPATEAVRAENARLEQLLATLPERRVMRGSTAFTVAELEDRLAMLDDRLTRVTLEPNAPERSERLWRQRAEVMNSLVQVRYADAIGAY
ncbi:MAG: hypothetical protein WD793_12550 [Steroidobacteraceae bacterium]